MFLSKRYRLKKRNILVNINMFSEDNYDKHINKIIDTNYTFVSPDRLSPVTQQLLHV